MASEKSTFKVMGSRQLITTKLDPLKKTFLTVHDANVYATVNCWDGSGVVGEGYTIWSDNVTTFYNDVKARVDASKISLITFHGDGRVNPFTIPGSGTPEELRSQDTPLGQICEIMGFSSVFEEQILRPSLTQNNGSFASFLERAEDSTPNNTVKDAINVIYGLPNSPAISLFLAFRFTSTHTTILAIVRTLSDYHVPIDLVTSSLPHSLAYPPHLLVCNYALAGSALETYRAERDHKLVSLEARILDSESGDYKSGTKFMRLMGESKRSAQKMLYMKNLSAYDLKAGYWIRGVMREWEEAFGGGLRWSGEVLRYHENLAVLRDQQSESLRGRLQALRELLFSVISQRDSAISTEIAHQSREIAASTLKDSFAMKTLAALNMLFLPTSLIAGVFSADILTPAESSSERNRYIRFFIGLSIGLTALTIAIWWAFLRLHGRRKNRTIEKINEAGPQNYYKTK